MRCFHAWGVASLAIIGSSLISLASYAGTGATFEMRISNRSVRLDLPRPTAPSRSRPPVGT